MTFTTSLKEEIAKNDINIIEARYELIAFLNSVAKFNKEEIEKKKESVLLTNAKDWIFTFMEGGENAESNSVAGTGSNDVATNGVPFWLTVDFKEVKTVTGIQTTHWGAGYAPSKVEIFSSENGDKWTSIGQWDTKGRNQTITFDERIKTRYLKYQMVTVPSRVDITKFYIYAWE